MEKIIRYLDQALEKKWKEKHYSSLLPFLYGICHSSLSFISKPNNHQEETNKLFTEPFQKRFKKIESLCEKNTLDYKLFWRIDIGRDEKCNSLIDYFPKGILELTYLQGNVINSNIEDNYYSLIIGMSIVYYKNGIINESEYQFILLRFGEDFLKKYKEPLLFLIEYFLEKEDKFYKSYIKPSIGPTRDFREIIQFPDDYSKYDLD